jgi:hypothetical protein
MCQTEHNALYVSFHLVFLLLHNIDVYGLENRGSDHTEAESYTVSQ